MQAFTRKSRNEPNSDWHAIHKLPENATLDQRVKWHMEHARRCPCPARDEDIRSELIKRCRGKHQDFCIDFNCRDHRALGLWAAQIAERLLPYFEEQHPDDTRPREAITTLLEWVKTGEFSMQNIRSAALGAHAAAKDVRDDPAASYAAHAAGQAAGTAHVPTHAIGTVLYAIKLAAFVNPTDIKATAARERHRQTNALPENLRGWVDAWVRWQPTG
jgi:hypothetical protein